MSNTQEVRAFFWALYFSPSEILTAIERPIDRHYLLLFIFDGVGNLRGLASVIIQAQPSWWWYDAFMPDIVELYEAVNTFIVIYFKRFLSCPFQSKSSRSTLDFYHIRSDFDTRDTLENLLYDSFSFTKIWTNWYK